jgi:uncharacterized protein
MKRDEDLQKLKEAEADLRAQGVAHAALFGAVARGENGPDSDIDIMVEIEPEARIACFSMWGSSSILRAYSRFPSMSPIAKA